MSPDTYGALASHGLLALVSDTLDEYGPGTRLIPPKCLAPDEASDLQSALTLVEPGHSDTCSLPHCMQDVTSVERGSLSAPTTPGCCRTGTTWSADLCQWGCCIAFWGSTRSRLPGRFFIERLCANEWQGGSACLGAFRWARRG
jgi:hypothetical protein